MSETPQDFGLLAHPLIGWLLSVEPDVRQLADDYVRERAGAHPGCQLALAPSLAEEQRLLRREHNKPHLETIQLMWSRVKHPQTGRLGLHVDISERDLERLAKHYVETQQRARRAAQGSTH